MAVVSYDVTYLDGRKARATTTPWAEILVERDHRQLRDAGQWQEWLYRLVWQSLTLQKEESRTFEDFAQALEEVNQAGDAPTPTPPAPSDDDSSS